MLDENLARLRANRNNIHRYRRQLNTKLSDIERQFIERRLQEEQSAIAALSGPHLPDPFCVTKNTGRAFPCGRHPMSDVRDVLIRGSKKIIRHYEFLISRTPNERERELYHRRIEREQRLLDELVQGGFPGQRAA